MLLVEKLEKTAGLASRFKELVIGEKLVRPGRQALKGALPFGSLAGVKGHRLGHLAGTALGSTVGVGVGAAVGHPRIGAALGGAVGAHSAALHAAGKQTLKFQNRLLGGGAALGATAGAVGLAGAYAHGRKKHAFLTAYKSNRTKLASLGTFLGGFHEREAERRKLHGQRLAQHGVLKGTLKSIGDDFKYMGDSFGGKEPIVTHTTDRQKRVAQWYRERQQSAAAEHKAQQKARGK